MVDTTAPAIFLNGDSNITHEAGMAYHDANATWTDAVDGQGVVYGVGEVNVSNPGIYYLTFDYTDNAGNVAQTVTRTVISFNKGIPLLNETTVRDEGWFTTWKASPVWSFLSRIL